MVKSDFLREIGSGTLGPGVQACLCNTGEEFYSVFASKGAIFNFSIPMASRSIVVDSHCLLSFIFFTFRQTEL